MPGCDAGVGTPVLIANTVIKNSRDDGTELVTVWESRSLPGVITAGRRVCFPAFHLSAREGEAGVLSPTLLTGTPQDSGLPLPRDRGRCEDSCPRSPRNSSGIGGVSLQKHYP